MRVLHVDHSPLLGGAERSVLELARAQLALGHEVAVAVGRSGSFGDALRAAGIPFVSLGWSRRSVETSADAGWVALLLGLLGAIGATLRLRRQIRRWRPDVVQAHTRKAQLVATLATIGSGTQLVWHLRDDVPTRLVTRVLQRSAMRRVDHAVALSEWLTAHYIAERITPRSGAIDHVPSGVDGRPFAALPTPWLDGARDPVVGYVGQIATWKAPHLLVDAAEALTDHPEIRFVITGNVWFRSSDTYGRDLERRVARSPARDRIARRSTVDPADAFGAIDILVHTSVVPEPFGRVIVEAMAAHRPVIAFRHGAPIELLGDDRGVFATSMDGPAIAEAIRAVVDDIPATRGRLRAATAAAAAYEPAAVARAMDRAYARMAR